MPLRRKTPPYISRPRGFTLIELLVVIGIITILIGMLLPTITRTREQGRLVSCSSNLRQVHVALVNYSLRYRDRFPDPITVGGASYRAAPGISTVGASFDTSSASVGPENLGLPSLLATEKLIPAGSKLWVCSSAPEVFSQWGATYAFTPSDNLTLWTSLHRGRPANRSLIIANDNYANLPYFSGKVRTWPAPSPETPAVPTTPGGFFLMPHRSSVGVKVGAATNRTVNKVYNALLVDGTVDLRGVYNPTKVR